MNFKNLILAAFLLVFSCSSFAYNAENELFRADGKHIVPGEHNHTEKEHQATENLNPSYNNPGTSSKQKK